jgi:hypothetical protein
VNNEMGMTGKEADVACFKEQFQHLSEGPEENHKAGQSCANQLIMTFSPH